MNTFARSAATLIAVTLLGSGSAFAASANSADQLSPNVSSMTCAQFTALTPAARKAALTESRATAPTTALSNTSDNASGVGNNTVTSAGSVATPDTPISGGQLIAACEAASPSQTLADAYSTFASGSSTTTTAN